MFLVSKNVDPKALMVGFFHNDQFGGGFGTRILNHCQLTWKPSRCSVTSCDDAIRQYLWLWQKQIHFRARLWDLKRCRISNDLYTWKGACQQFRWIHASLYSTGERTQKSTVTWKLLPQASFSKVISHLKKMRSQKGKNHYLYPPKV